MNGTKTKHLIQLLDYNLKIDEGYRYISVTIDKLMTLNWQVHWKTELCEQKKNHSKTYAKCKSSKIKATWIRTDNGKKGKKMSMIFWSWKKIERIISYTSKTAILVRKPIENLSLFVKKSVFEQGIAIWIDEITSVTKTFYHTKQSSIKLTPIQASIKKIKVYVRSNQTDKRKQ